MFWGGNQSKGLLADVELEEIDKYSALVFTPAAGDSQHAEGNRQAVAALAASLAGTRSMLRVVIPDFDQVRQSQTFCFVMHIQFCVFAKAVAVLLLHP